MRDCTTVRVAVPLEMCWHEVPGGTARAAIDLVAALQARQGLEMVGVSARHREDPDPVWAPPVAVEQLPLPRAVLYESWHRVRRPKVEQATGPVDLVHVMAGAVAPSDAPMVATIHDLAFRHHPDLFTPRGVRFFERALELIDHHASAVLCSSRTTQADCVAAGIDHARIHHVPLAVQVSRPGPEHVTAVRRRFGIEGPYALFVGTIEPRKNLKTLLEAWRRLRPGLATLVVVGPEGWGDAVGDGPLPAGVQRVGFVDNHTRDALYTGARVSCYPSLFEGFGMPVLESMALGCPVVTSARTACEELVAEGGGLAVDATDPDAIAAAIERILVEDDVYEHLSLQAEAVASHYSWERTSSLVFDRYRAVLHDR